MKTAGHELLCGRGVFAVPIAEVGMFQPQSELDGSRVRVVDTLNGGTR
jgi:hypothetical protein